MSSTSRGAIRQQILSRAASEDDEQHERDQVHEPIPPDRNGPDLKGDRIELGVYKHAAKNVGFGLR
jgi:hypothetical protein